ncbi:DUF58 domain-containing protein [Occultella gossypii]|uniref:DUF58 domain-containing protein n=1 Tax=Occultella gossypii TaxID=2800820 RepID=A0ABS7S6I6_9MICO|nr:DUF58 domain-containing protein [Occultella gossypii]MBZ2195234.1 DUF58 domain-containing protein [Occultella gossypii]
MSGFGTEGVPRSINSTTSSVTRVVAGLVTQVRRTTSVLTWVTRAAWVVLGAGVVALVAGFSLNWIELIVLGAGFVFALLGAAIFAIGRHPYAISLRLREGRVVVGERAMGGIDIRNTSTSAVLPARIELPVGTTRASFALPALPPEGEHDELFAIPTTRRGVIVVGPVSSVRGDPLGLIRRSVLWTEPEELYVHPRTIRMGGSAAGFLHDLEGRETREITNADLSFHALREYVPGDDRRYVHWRSSARTGTLMVRQFEETRRSHLVLAISAQERDYADPDEFELAISAVGSLGLQALNSEKQLTAMTSHEVLRTSAPRLFLDELTRLETVKSPTTVVEMARTITRDVLRATVAVLICGSSVSARDIRAAGAVLPVGVRALAIQARLGAEPSVHRLGSVTVLELGALEDLPRGFRKLER